MMPDYLWVIGQCPGKIRMQNRRAKVIKIILRSSKWFHVYFRARLLYKSGINLGTTRWPARFATDHVTTALIMWSSAFMTLEWSWRSVLILRACLDPGVSLSCELWGAHTRASNCAHTPHFTPPARLSTHWWHLYMSVVKLTLTLLHICQRCPRLCLE